MTVDRTAARAAVETVLSGAELVVDEIRPDVWATQLAGEFKRTLPVLIELDERALRVVALVCGAPDEGHAEVFRLLLLRNRRTLPVHFALDDSGDVVLLGAVPLEAVDEEAIDALLGALLQMADDVYNAILRHGFATYIEGEQRWRERVGMPPNPVTGTP